MYSYNTEKSFMRSALTVGLRCIAQKITTGGKLCVGGGIAGALSRLLCDTILALPIQLVEPLEPLRLFRVIVH